MVSNGEIDRPEFECAFTDRAVLPLLSGITGATTNEWEYGTYEFDEQNMSSSNSTTEENNEYIPGTFEGTLRKF